MIILKDLIQGSEEWLKEKAGKPSASSFSKVITGSGKKSTSKEGYLYELSAESLIGVKADGFKSDAMEMGNEREQESRELYELISGDTIDQVGVVYSNEDRKYLCSPDGICNKKEYGLELKNVLPKTMVKYLLKGVLPSEYKVQIQFSLMVTGLKYWMFVAYCPGIRPLILKVEREDALIDILREEAVLLCGEIDEIVAKLGNI